MLVEIVKHNVISPGSILRVIDSMSDVGMNHCLYICSLGIQSTRRSFQSANTVAATKREVIFSIDDLGLVSIAQ